METLRVILAIFYALGLSRAGRGPAPLGNSLAARACAANPVALAIPCHRVVRADGDPGGYRWGMGRKRALLKAERRQE